MIRILSNSSSSSSTSQEISFADFVCGGGENGSSESLRLRGGEARGEGVVRKVLSSLDEGFEQPKNMCRYFQSPIKQCLAYPAAVHRLCLIDR
jgi:hypothetical protein